mgnify:CR=1 FL=1
MNIEVIQADIDRKAEAGEPVGYETYLLMEEYEKLRERNEGLMGEYATLANHLNGLLTQMRAAWQALGVDPFASDTDTLASEIEKHRRIIGELLRGICIWGQEEDGIPEWLWDSVTEANILLGKKEGNKADATETE